MIDYVCVCVGVCACEPCTSRECHRANKALGNVVRDELQGAPSSRLQAPGSMSPAAVVLHSGFGSGTVAVSAVLSFGSMRSLEAFCGRVGLFV